MKSLVYLAQPIDQAAGKARITRVRQVAEDLLALGGFAVYRPAHAFHKFGQGRKFTHAEAESVDAINAAALSYCESLVAVLPSGVATLGTPVEIERYLTAGKPVAIVTDHQLADSSVQVRAWQQTGAMVIPWEQAERDPFRVGEVLGRHLSQAARRDEPALPRMSYVRSDVLAVPPGRAYPDDAGLDLAACEDKVIAPGGSALIRTGLKFALPAGHFGLIVGRSSAWAKRRLDVKLGVIDAGWRGELFISVKNDSDEKAEIKVGERIAQYIVLPAWLGNLAEVEVLTPHARGENGFGSSGR